MLEPKKAVRTNVVAKHEDVIPASQRTANAGARGYVNTSSGPYVSPRANVDPDSVADDAVNRGPKCGALVSEGTAASRPACPAVGAPGSSDSTLRVHPGPVVCGFLQRRAQQVEVGFLCGGLRGRRSRPTLTAASFQVSASVPRGLGLEAARPQLPLVRHSRTTCRRLSQAI